MTLTPNVTASTINWGMDETNSYVLVTNDQGRTLYAKAVYLITGQSLTSPLSSPPNWGVGETNSFLEIDGANRTLYAKAGYYIKPV